MPAKAPPVLKGATEKEKQLSLSEKLRLVDNEIETLRNYCLSNGISPSELENLASPLLKTAFRAKFKFWIKLSLSVCLIGSLIMCVLYSFVSSKQIVAYGRNTFIKLLPYWDWTKFYYADCLIPNPYYDRSKLRLEDCHVCESVDDLEHLTNATQSEIIQNYLKNDIPVIVLDAMETWPIMNEEFSFRNITQIYLSHDEVHNFIPCALSTNIRIRGDGYFKNFLKKIDSTSTKRWFSHWENCDKQASKAIRTLYDRPYFLSPIIDTSGPNWIFLSSDYRSRAFKKVSVASEIMWFAQVRGTNRIRLSPKEPCSSICVRLADTLYEGEILLFTDAMWWFEYMPGEDQENIALAVGAFWEI